MADSDGVDPVDGVGTLDAVGPVDGADPADGVVGATRVEGADGTGDFAWLAAGLEGAGEAEGSGDSVRLVPGPALALANRDGDAVADGIDAVVGVIDSMAAASSWRLPPRPDCALLPVGGAAQAATLNAITVTAVAPAMTAVPRVRRPPA